MKSKPSIAAIRRALRAQFGPRRYRITSDGEIHTHGTMPNTNQTDWFLFGWVDKYETWHRLGLTT